MWDNLFPNDPSVCMQALLAWRYDETRRVPCRNRPMAIVQMLTSTFGVSLLKNLLRLHSPSLLHCLIDTMENCKNRQDLGPSPAGIFNWPRVQDDLEDMLIVALTMSNIGNNMFDDELVRWAENTGTNDDLVTKLRVLFKQCEDIISMVCETPYKSYAWMRNDGGATLASALQQVDKIQDCLSNVAARIYISAPHPFPSCQPLLQISKKAQIMRQRYDQPGLRLLEYHASFRWEHRCYGPGCLANAHDLRRPLQACSRCKRARYCSRACQRRAWRLADAPHRGSVCKIMALLWRLESVPEYIVTARGLITSIASLEETAATNRHLDAIHKSQFDAMGKPSARMRISHCTDCELSIKC
jgi:hypothetical protein